MRLAIILLSSLILAACANTAGDVYTRDQAMREMNVQYGVIESVREVTLAGSQSGVGAVAGGAVGGIAGSSVGHNRDSAIGAVVGAVAGGLAGNALEKLGTQEKGQEITVRLENGRLISVVQAGEEKFQAGERVRVLSGRGETRVSR
jgi:outer membrane lipoprotein SlyB